MRSLTCVGLTALSGCLFLLCVGRAVADDSIDWKARFLKEAPRRWQEYKELRILQGSYEATCLVGEKVVNRSRCSFKQNKSCALTADEKLLEPSGPITLQASNSRYGFQITRRSDDKPWVLTGQDLNLKDGWKLSKASPAVAIQNWLSLAFNLEGTGFTRLPDLVPDPDFSVTSAARVVRDSTELVEVKFIAKPKRGPEGAWRPVAGGWILFDPARYWVMREFEVDFLRSQDPKEPAERVTGTFAYADGNKKLPVPRRMLRKSSVGIQVTHVFDLIERDDVPDEEFTLSAFGLP
jgi:hypothetical protein